MASQFHILFCAAYFIGFFQTTSSISSTYGNNFVEFHLQTPTFTQRDESSKYTQINMTCSPDKPFILRKGNHSVCVSSCGPTMVADGSKCIHVTECHKPVLSNGRCMDLCPAGYLYVTFDSKLTDAGCGEQYYNECDYTVKDIGINPCVMVTYLIVTILLYVLGIVLYIAFLWMFFSTRQFPVINLIAWFKEVKIKKMTSSDDELLINADVEDG